MAALIVKRLSLEDFAQYKSLDVELSPGLTLIVGRNGAGKSTLIEGICWALYGESVRGEAPQTGKAQVNLENKLRVMRERSPKPLLKLLSREGEGSDLSGQTNTETQHKIDDLFGSWARFANTRVFARESMARFGAATDKERKGLLEGMLGLEHFDKALAAARADLRLQETAAAGAERAVSLHGERVAKLQARLETMEPPKRGVAEVEDDLAKDNATQEARDRRQAALSDLVVGAKGRLAGAAAEARASQSRVSSAQAQLDKIANRTGQLSAGPCPLCLRPVDSGVQSAVDAHWRAEAAPLAQLLLEAKNALLSAQEDAKEADEELSSLSLKVSDCRAEAVGSRARAAQLAGELLAARAFEAETRRLQDELSSEGTAAAAAQAELEAARHRQGVLNAACDVLGIRGARNLLLGRALSRLEAETNRVLRALGYPIQIRIKGTATQRSGKEVDAISIAVEGPTADSYRALSTSERARVDTALLLGLASLQSGADEGLIVFDEVFDSLDAEGIEPLAQYLSALAETRQVLVISHHPEVRALFPRCRVLQASRNDRGNSQVTEI